MKGFYLQRAIVIGQGFFTLSVVDDQMLLILSLCPTQERDNNFLIRMVMFCEDLVWSFLLKEEKGYFKSYTRGIQECSG